MFLCLRDYLYPTLTRESHFSRKTCHLEKRRRYNVWKSPKNVAYNIASEASYVYILSRQKLIKKMPKMVKLWKTEACGQIVLPDKVNFNKTKNGENAKK